MNGTKPFEQDTPLIARYRQRFENHIEGEPLSFAESKEMFEAFQKLNRRLGRITRISDNYHWQVKHLVEELQDALDSIKTLKGLIPICASCKKIRNDDGYWKVLEQYVAEHSDALLTHGLCPECAHSDYPMLDIHVREHDQPLKDEALKRTDLNDPVILDVLPVINNQHFIDAPLYPQLLRLFENYVRLAKRMKRIIKISDGYQARARQQAPAPEEEAPRLHALFAAIPLPLMLLGPDGTIRQINNHFTFYFGYTMKELPTISDWWQVRCPEEAERRLALAIWETALQRIATEEEAPPCRFWGKEGRLLRARISLRPIEEDLLVIFQPESE